MTYVGMSGWAQPERGAPSIRRITFHDLGEALKAGFADFSATPTHTIFIAIIYPVIGLVITRMTMGEGLLPVVYPLMAGFALVGPFAALGLYELSRRREQGLDLFWTHAFDVFRSASLTSILTLGAVQMLIFIAWIATANALYNGLFGAAQPASFGDLARLVLTTAPGWALIIFGNGIGLVFAIVAMTLSVVSFPLMLDRHVGVATAVTISIAAVRTNPGPMAAWGLLVALLLVAGTLPFFIGLAVVLPILGHATWHLYRALVPMVPGRA